MILVKATPDALPEDFLLVAQNIATYECLGFSATGTPFDYDTDHIGFNGRYKPRTNALPATLSELEVDFFGVYVYNQKVQAKKIRDASRYHPLTVTIGVDEVTFDMDSTSQDNIKATLQSFEAARLAAVAGGWPDDGTLPWTLEDNSVRGVTLAELQAVHDAAVVRGYELHLAYQLKKAELEALLPVV